MPSRAAEGTPRTEPFADRLAALVGERRSQVCIGFERAAAAVETTCAELIEQAGPASVAVKPQLARFEALGAPGIAALESVCGLAPKAGLLVIADGKRGDVPVSATAYGAAMVGATVGDSATWRPNTASAFTARATSPSIGLSGSRSMQSCLSASTGVRQQSSAVHVAARTPSFRVGAVAMSALEIPRNRSLDAVES